MLLWFQKNILVSRIRIEPKWNVNIAGEGTQSVGWQIRIEP